MLMSVRLNFDLLRHGQTRGGMAYRGSLDDPLSAEGWQQMQAAFDAHGPWEHIVSSPLSRCLAPARRWAETHDLPLREEPRLREMHFGIWEGLTSEQLMERDPEGLRRFWEDPVAHVPQGAEPLPEFRERVLEAWQELLRESAPGRMLIVTHGGVIRLLLLHLQGRPLSDLLKLEVPHAALFRIEMDTAGGLIASRALHEAAP